MPKEDIDLRRLLLDLRALSPDDLVLLRVLIETDTTIRADKRRPLVDLLNNLQAANAESANAESMTKT
jgi:hypothetical protein